MLISTSVLTVRQQLRCPPLGAAPLQLVVPAEPLIHLACFGPLPALVVGDLRSRFGALTAPLVQAVFVVDRLPEHRYDLGCG